MRQAYLDVGVLHVLPDRDLLVGRFEGVFEQVALPIVFLGALSHSADAHPQSMREMLTTLAQPVKGAVEHAIAYCRQLK